MTTLSTSRQAHTARKKLAHILQSRFEGLVISDNYTERDDALLYVTVDPMTIPANKTADDLTSRAILHHMTTVLGHHVSLRNTTELTYIVELKPPERPRLKKLVNFSLKDRPPGDMMLPVGVARSGPVWKSLPELRHVLIAGLTGSGKSSWVRSAIAGLVLCEGPDRLRLALIDPKRTELAPWQNISHTLGYACDPDDSVALAWQLCEEMDRRGDLLAQEQVFDIAKYNERVSEPLPYILVIVDELVDLALATGGATGRFMEPLIALVSKGRAAGILVWGGAQHPRGDVLNRLAATNMDTRIVFRVQDSKAAEMVGVPKAVQIPGDRPGRCLAKLSGAQPVAMQAYFIGEDRAYSIARSVGRAQTERKVCSLSDEEQRLAKLLVGEFEGVFVIDKVAAMGNATQGGFSRRWLRNTATMWLAKGYLAEDRSDPKHPRRMVTDKLRAELAS